MTIASATSVRPARSDDGEALARIYNHYVLNTCVTFETDAVTAGDMAARIRETLDAGLPWLLAEGPDGAPLGYAYASRWKGRCAYRHTVESTVYLDAGAVGRGIGQPLYGALLDAIRACGMHAVIGGIALPNARSIALHERLAFHKVAHFEQVGRKQDRWIDVGYWQRLF